jgi:predicted amino acid-binding ACT domain protein
MELTENDMNRIVQMVSDRLGPNAGIDDVKNMVSEIIERLSIPVSEDSKGISIAGRNQVDQTSAQSLLRLIVNGFGLNRSGFEDEICSCIAGRALRLDDMSSTLVGTFRSIIAIIDYSEFKGDLNQLKCDISRVGEDLGYKVLIQESRYYGT